MVTDTGAGSWSWACTQSDGTNAACYALQGSGSTSPSSCSQPAAYLFLPTSVFNLPLGTGAQWQSNAQLSGSNIFINTDGNYNEPIFTSTASDPLVTVSDSNGSEGLPPATYQAHIPAGAAQAVGGDAIINVDDLSSNTFYTFGGFNWTTSTTATSQSGNAEPDNGSGIEVNNSDFDEGAGTLRGIDLTNGTINHMLRIELPFGMLKSYSQTSTTVLCPYCWPDTQEDGFALNGDGNPPYTGTVYFGATIGIPASVAEPADIAASPGAHMLWVAMQTHGAMVRGSGGSGSTVTLQTDQNIEGSNPLIQDMEQYGAEIMSNVQILTNQGPNSINGGGTPVVPIDCVPANGVY